ncbi:MAG: glycosyltransferase family 2 protein [Nitrospinota bacterium]|nr:glycosyltransferase family 2 protein [Nitrospinota bacterium]
MPPDHLDISVIIPGYNEEASIEASVSRCLAALKALKVSHEILLVDDASTDATSTIADRLAEEHPSVRVIHNPINLGVGTSLLVGARAARGNVTIHNGMDLPFDPSDLGKVLPHFPQADVVVVIRTDRSAHSPWRRLTSFVHHWLVRLLFWIDVPDLNFTQAYKREVIQSLPVKARSPAFVTPELIIRARDAGYRLAQVRAVFHRRESGAPYYGRPRDILWTLADIASFWIERHLRRG